ncbi:hypothetical protein [Dactylosporangium sp. NPDC006015]|uniref:hypothetical protein n=1 Tax=Dactylosporangium sp. NPDC006015 TaxID=3154576 RepID=UPI0033AEDBF5
MFKNVRGGSILLAGLVGSVVLRGALWVLTVSAVGPLLGPVAVLAGETVGRAAGTAVWAGDIVASVLCAAATGVACHGLHADRAWAFRLGRGLAWFYVAVNAIAAAACVALMPGWGQLAAPFALYAVSLLVAVAALRRLGAERGSAMVVGIAALRRTAAAAAGR